MGNVVERLGFAIAGFFLKGYQMTLGASPSAPPEPNPPPGIKKLNDSVWELYAPSGMPDMEIIFYHGLQLGDFEDAFWKTWRAKDEELVWPQHWLSKIFPNARILSISYNTSVIRRDAQLDMYALGENLVKDIILNTYNIGQNCPVFLVGHSLGGIIIKQFILSAINERNKQSQAEKEKIDLFLRNFKSVFYYATPHGGSEIADLARRIPNTSPILELLKTLDTDRARINYEFSQERENKHAQAYAVAECQPIHKYGFSKIVVHEASARQDIDNYYTYTTADHFTVCKARSINDTTVIGSLTQFITRSMPEGYVAIPRQDALIYSCCRTKEILTEKGCAIAFSMAP